eukprot:GEMP01090337.1.p1 GENE.GEMP01090337.1~~GEMP01090337.1.p1  ORF type:complete len:184 (+),score=19.55 GEMP01090337.1:70-552(+)
MEAFPDDALVTGSVTTEVLTLGSYYTNAVGEYARGKINGREAAIGVTENAHRGKCCAARRSPSCQSCATWWGSGCEQKLIEFANWLFQPDPDDGLRRASNELGVNPYDCKRVVNRVFMDCHPDSESGLSREEFHKKHMAYVMIKQIRIARGRWCEDAKDQ